MYLSRDKKSQSANGLRLKTLLLKVSEMDILKATKIPSTCFHQEIVPHLWARPYFLKRRAELSIKIPQLSVPSSYIFCLKKKKKSSVCGYIHGYGYGLSSVYIT